MCRTETTKSGRDAKSCSGASWLHTFLKSPIHLLTPCAFSMKIEAQNEQLDPVIRDQLQEAQRLKNISQVLICFLSTRSRGFPGALIGHIECL